MEIPEGTKKPSEALRTGMRVCRCQCRGQYIRISPRTGGISACAVAVIYAGYMGEIPFHWGEGHWSGMQVAQDLYQKTGIGLSQPIDPARPSLEAIIVICDFNDEGLSLKRIAQRLEQFGV